MKPSLLSMNVVVYGNCSMTSNGIWSRGEDQRRAGILQSSLVNEGNGR